MSLVIVDTGCANLASVQYAFERLGIEPLVSDDPVTILSAERVVLPGVGSAPFAMRGIHAKGLGPVLQSLKQPVIGICLGMQLLYETLEEGGETVEGLGLIPGTIEKLQTGDLPAPHMGWNTLQTVKQDPLLNGISDGDYAYFVHSYAAFVSDSTLMTAEYGSAFTAITRSKNVWGCQFHPERSSKTGALILKNFLDINL
ncbi:imidazole glycerol phosphate synthase subunit HisH [Litorimonas cladophorae]|uniref:Imidazole glycerol phosphate synthase subunit HisH n=1 Tax=Litorimonas cladophorae TaxID=1220491 RepID=A0A918KDH3_9PROT|nr:imidazole glycerol phosphate synthase subunit HisH [Litorimonas cladophorae]GGX58967.1 imidazole glycerol phosphate synthase subunit HisH [Litorimonas cladophorae]